MMNSVGTHNETTRIAWLEKTLQHLPPGTRILDAGAGEQQFRKFCSHLIYVAQDFAQYDGKGDAKGLQVGSWDQSKLDIVSDITAIPEPDGSFDAIMCVEVLEHLPDPLAAIREFARLLHPGGQLILTAPFCCLTHFAPYHFSTGYNSYYYTKHLQDTGFTIDEVTQNGNFFEFLAQETRRIPDVAARYCAESTSIIERLGIYIVLKMLQRFSNMDKGSQELLCFGYHIRAMKS